MGGAIMNGLPLSYEQALKEWRRFEAYLVRERYAVRDPASGVPLEQNLAQVLDRISRQFTIPEVRDAILAGRIITATPFLMNGGNPYTRRQGFYSCYPLGYVEDSNEAIFQMEHDLGVIFLHCGGGGIDVSKLRPRGALVDNGQGLASGPVSFAKGFSQLSARISQGGKRRGALMIQADWDIPDIREFVSFKAEETGRYSGCNVSVNVTSERFWQDENLLDFIATNIWKSGDPGLLFTQKSLDNTPVPRRYNPIFSNPCGEYLSTRETACNLLTVCLPRCFGASMGDYLEAVFANARLAALAGNEILDLGGFPPLARIREATLLFRPIGVGATGLHHAMNHHGVSYNDPEGAPRFAKATQLVLMLGSMQGSLDYASRCRELGRDLEVREWRLDYVERISSAAMTFIEAHLDAPQIWLDRALRLFDRVRRLGGLYNSVTTSQPPTGSTSQLMKVACTGIEPYYSLVQKRRVWNADSTWEEFTLVPLELYHAEPSSVAWVEGQTAHHISPVQQIRVIEACQAFNHTAVSKTINLPAEATVADIKELLFIARDSSLKGITIFRDSSMPGVLVAGVGPEAGQDGSHPGPAGAAASSFSACPICGMRTAKRSGGCSFCIACGFSTC